MNCSKCNAWVPDDSAFCPECGQKVETPAPEAQPSQVFCPNCGAAMAPDDSFCENCGAKIEAEPAAASPAISVSAILSGVAAALSGGLNTVAGKLKLPAKYLKLGVAAVALVLVIVLIASLFSGPEVYNYGLYIKDGELQYTEMPKGKDVVEVTSNLFDGSDVFLPGIAFGLGSEVRLSADGKKLFFPDKIEYISDYGYASAYTLYYREINNAKKEPVKIDSGVTGYSINEKGSLVTYMKDGNLYQHDMKDKVKIDSDVRSYRVSEDGKTLLYLVWESGDEAGTLYLKKGSKDAEKIASDVTGIVSADEKFKTFVYEKDDSLYLKSGSKDAEKIASDVTGVLYVYESGEFYFTTAEEATVTYWDLIENDLSEEDSWYLDYYEDWMRESTISYPFKTLNYFDGKKSVVVSESMTGWNTCALDSPVLIFHASENTELPTWSLTEYVNESFSFSDKMAEYLSEDRLTYIASEASVGELGLEDIYNAALSDNGKTLYVSTDFDSDEGIVTLYKLTLNGSKVKKSEKLDEDVSRYNITVVGEDSVVYFKEVDDGEGELYMDGKKVDDDVNRYSTYYNTETEDLYYRVDCDEDKELGTLKYWNGKKATTVKDDVYYFYFTPAGETLFLYDYDNEDYEGELWIQDGKKVTKLADEVTAIVPVY